MMVTTRLVIRVILQRTERRRAVLEGGFGYGLSGLVFFCLPFIFQVNFPRGLLGEIAVVVGILFFSIFLFAGCLATYFVYPYVLNRKLPR